MRTLRPNATSASSAILAILVAAPMLSACQPSKPAQAVSVGTTAPKPVIPVRNKGYTPYTIDWPCQGVNPPKKTFRLVIDKLNINHLIRDITDEAGQPAKYPIKNSPYNTLYDLDLTDHLKADGDAVTVRVIMKDNKVDFANFPEQITAGDDQSRPMFCGLTATGAEASATGAKWPYVEFVVKYAKGAGDANHIGNFNINLVARDSMVPSASLPFSLDPHVGNNG